MDDKKHPRPLIGSISRGMPRGAAERRIRARLIRQPATTAADAIRRVQPRHRDYVMRRAEGLSPAKAWKATMPPVKNPDTSARRLENSPIVKTAIDAATTVAIKGSLMSAAQRRDYVLDQLIVESQMGGDSARVRSLELLGKTAGLFIDRQEVTVTDGADIKTRIEEMIRSIRERDITPASDAISDETTTGSD